MVNTNSGAPDQIYNNTIRNFEYGIQAINTNQSSVESMKGLTFQCNTMGPNNDDNETDFFVALNGSIAGLQVSQTEAAKNQFSLSSSTGHFMNYGPIIIYHAEPSWRPANHTGIAVYSNQNSTLPSCSPWTRPSMVTNPVATIQEIESIETLIGQDKSLLAQPIDEGSTPQLEAQILFASSQSEYQTLYIEMMDISPYVSEENLLNLIDIEDFPELA